MTTPSKDENAGRNWPVAGGAELFRAAPLAFLPIGEEYVIAQAGPMGGAPRTLLTGVERRVLGICSALAGFEEHAAVVAGRLGIGESEAADQLRSFAARGLLLGTGRLEAAFALNDSEPKPLAEVAIFTHDRPQAMVRCAKGYLENLLLYERREACVTVWDDSEEAASSAVASAQVGWLAEATPVRVAYVNLAARRQFFRHLVERGIPAEVLEFGFFPREGRVSPGANRNAALIDALGRRVLFVDDDTSALAARHPDMDPGLRVCGHDDPREVRFFRNRREAVEASNWLGFDLLGAHERLLGRSLGGCMGAAEGVTRLGDVCGHLLADAGSAHAKVAYTMPGKIGDCGRGSAAWIAAALDRARPNSGGFAEGLFAGDEPPREIREVTRFAAVAHDVGCMATVLGVDGRLPLPPFLPHFTSEDVIFGRLLHLTMPQALVGLPGYSVLHDAAPGRRYPRRQMLLFWSAAAALIGMCPLESADPLTCQRLLGRWLVEAGTLDDEEFRRVLRQIERHISRPAGLPAALLGHLRRQFEGLAEMATRGDARPPLEFAALGERAWASVRRELRGFGQLLVCWGEICARTRELYGEGVTLRGLSGSALGAG